jgi:hypothetical protein
MSLDDSHHQGNELVAVCATLALRLIRVRLFLLHRAYQAFEASIPLSLSNPSHAHAGSAVINEVGGPAEKH